MMTEKDCIECKVLNGDVQMGKGTSEESSPIERIAAIEASSALRDKWALGLLSVLVAVSVGINGFYGTKIIQHESNIAGLASAQMIMMDTQALHVFDDSKHQNNTPRVDDLTQRDLILTDRVADALAQASALKEAMDSHEEYGHRHKE